MKWIILIVLILTAQDKTLLTDVKEGKLIPASKWHETVKAMNKQGKQTVNNWDGGIKPLIDAEALQQKEL